MAVPAGKVDRVVPEASTRTVAERRSHGDGWDGDGVRERGHRRAIATSATRGPGDLDAGRALNPSGESA